MKNIELFLILLAAAISYGQSFTYDPGSDQIVIGSPPGCGFTSLTTASDYNDAGEFIYQYDYWYGPTKETYIYIENTAEEFFYLQTVRINRYGRETITQTDGQYFRGTTFFYQDESCRTRKQRPDDWFTY